MPKPNENPFADWHKLTAFQKLNCINDNLLSIQVGSGLAAEYMIHIAQTMEKVVRLESSTPVIKRHD